MLNRTRTSTLDAFGLRNQRNRIYPALTGSDGSTLSLDFTTMSSLDSRFTFSRSSPATFINSSGLVQYADQNLVINSVLDGAGTGNAPTSWIGSTGINLTIPSAGTRRAETTTAAQNWTAAQTFASQIGITYSTSVLITSVSGQHYANTVSVVGSPTLVGYYRNGSSVGQFTTAEAGLITIVWTATSTNNHAMRVGVGSTGANVANAVCEFTQPRTIVGNNLQPAYIANTSTSSALQLARFDYDPTTLAPRGLLIEGSATNLATNSDTLPTGTSWFASSVTRTNVSSVTPDGLTTTTTCGLSATGSGSFRSVAITVTASTTYTFSFWARNNGGSVALYRAFNVSGGSDIVADTSYFSQINSSTWTRIQFTFTTPVGCTSVYVYPLSQNSGTSNVLIWGAQLESGSGASSYIPTGTSTVQRAADHCTMPTSSFITGNPYPNTLFVDCIPMTPNAGFLTLVRLFDRTVGGTFSYGNEIYYYSAATMSVNRKVTAPTNTDRTMGTSLAYNTRHKFASAVDSASFIGSRDGVTDSAATTAPASLGSVVTHIGIGCNGDAVAASVMNGWVRQIKFWPIALPQATINSLTTL